MGKAVRWLVTGAASVAGLGVAAAAIVYVASERILDRRYDAPALAVPVPSDADALREGQRLAKVHGCLTGCHGRNGEGGVMFDEPAIARLVAPNLTMIVRRRSDAQLVTAIRHGVRADGRSLIVMPAESFAMLSDGDLGRIIGYLRSLPPAPGPEASIEVGPLGRIGLLTGRFKMTAQLIRESRPPPEPRDPALVPGRYLAVTTCGHCHGLDLGGSSTPDFTAPSLRIVAAYTPEAFATLLRTGSAVGGRELKVMSAFARANLSYLNDTEIDALYRYLHAESVEAP